MENPIARQFAAIWDNLSRLISLWGLCRQKNADNANPNFGFATILGLFEFIDWVLQLEESDEERLWNEVKTLQEGKNMPYITSVERIGIRKGREEGKIEGKIEDAKAMLTEGLDVRFIARITGLSEVEIRELQQ